MAVTLASADNALKTLYLDVVAEQLNKNVNPLLARIKQSTNDVWGKEVRKVATYGVNGGVGAGSEDGALPKSAGNKYGQFVATLKNLYGTIEISDKAIRASEHNSGAFVNLLNDEMEGLIKASSFNFGRMLFGDGSGALACVEEVMDNEIRIDTVKNLAEGMIIDVYDANSDYYPLQNRRIKAIDRSAKTVILEGEELDDYSLSNGCILVLQGSHNKEITGLGAIFNEEADMLYGLKTAENRWLKPYINQINTSITENAIQKTIDTIEERSGSQVNFIVCSWGVRRALQKLFSENKRNLDVMELSGGFKAMSYNGIPIVADRFCPAGTMYLLNTDDFTLHQLCDWQWLADDDGKVLKQIPGKPVYTATLVKYAELMCSRPNGQGAILGIKEE